MQFLKIFRKKPKSSVDPKSSVEVDPNEEYNKCIEGFYMHYHPSTEDVFRSIV